MKDFDQSFEIEARDPQDPEKLISLTISRDERLKRERTFKIGGETFTHKVGVRPEVLEPWLTSDELSDEWLKILDETVEAMLEPGQEEKWRRVRSPEAPNPLTQIDLTAVIRWLIEVTAGRPTGPPSGSSDGRNSTETNSTVDSSSAAAAVSAA